MCVILSARKLCGCAFNYLSVISRAVAFMAYDLDGDGLISAQDLFNSLQRITARNLSDGQLEQVEMHVLF